MKTLVTLVALALAAASPAAQAVGRLADLVVHDRSTGRELPVHWHEGRAYVVGKPGNEYQVVLRNRRSEDVLAVVSVDGVNVLTGQTAASGQGGYVVGARDRVYIRGWRKSLGEVASFYFTSLGDSYAARTERPANVGVIGVALFRRAPRIEPLPDPVPFEERSKLERRDAPAQSDTAEPLAKRQAQAESRAAAPSAPLGTGHGRREESRAYYTAFERATREPEETISIYYDSYRNLVAQGILQPYAERRDPKPFPSTFVPDPPRSHGW